MKSIIALLIPTLLATASANAKAKEDPTSAGGYTAFTKAVDAGNEANVNSEAKLLLEKHPDDELVLNGLAHFYRKAGKPKMAEVLTRKVLAKNPNNLRAKMNLGQLLLARHEDSKALQTFLEVFNADKTYPDAVENIANLYLTYARKDQALSVLRESINVKDIDSLLEKEAGKNRSAIYISLLETDPALAKSETAILKKLANQSTDTTTASRAKTLLGKG